MARLLSLRRNEIVQRANELLLQTIQKTLHSRTTARLAISGGSATGPLPLLRKALGSDWQHVKLTWVDERCVNYAHLDSNRGSLYRQGGLNASDPPAFELALWHDGETPKQAIRRVERALCDEFAGSLDVALLGMGSDGHIASLFPQHAVDDDESGLVAYVPNSPKPPSRRMTLRLPFLKNTSHSFMIALGEEKRAAIERVLADDPALPASALENLTILTDIKTTGPMT